jgi:hypothetical protein
MIGAAKAAGEMNVHADELSPNLGESDDMIAKAEGLIGDPTLREEVARCAV